MRNAKAIGGLGHLGSDNIVDGDSAVGICFLGLLEGIELSKLGIDATIPVKNFRTSGPGNILTLLIITYK